MIDVELILTSDFVEPRGAWAAVGLVVGWGFIGVGLFTWSRRPDNSVGPLMTATGFAWFVGLLSAANAPLLFTIGTLFSSVYLVTAIHMLLAAPHGRRLPSWDRRIVTAGYALVTVGLLPLFLFFEFDEDHCAGCPDNVLLIERSDTFVDIYGGIVNVLGIALIVSVLATVIRRWRAATRPERRLYAPMYAAGVALLIALIAQLGFQTAGSEGETLSAIFVMAMVPLVLVPYLFLGSLLRTRMMLGGAMGQLVQRLGETPLPGGLRDALADALDDPTLELVYWIPDGERFVDFEGRTYELPEDDPRRAIEKVEREGDCVAAIVYDATLRDAGEHVSAVGAAAALALENERLDAELRAKVDELRGSRERMLRIGLEERRRLERDLHDGAQQRLVSIALNMRMARAKLNDDPLAADALLGAAGDELEAALEDLRELARGIHPAVLSDRGLATAIETLASRAPLPVELGRLPEGRLPEGVELAAYFVVAEALTNIAKYARATRARVGVARENGRLLVEVEDDGVGGADPEGGTGLRGLADRLAVIEGRLEVESEEGRGTTVRARIPCE